MVSLIATLPVGILIMVFGIVNMTGNISSLHSYHRHRVTEEDRKPFGKRVGLGTLICGVSVLIYGVIAFLGETLDMEILVLVGAVLLLVGIAVGAAISLLAIKKYNKGIF